MVVAGAAALHFWWRRRYDLLREQGLKDRQAHAEFRQRRDQDIAQKQAEEQALFNSMAEGVLVLDQTGHVQLVNRSLQEFFGLKSDVRGQSIMEAFRLQDLAGLIQRLPAEGIVEGHELELPGVNGRWLEVNASAVRDVSGRQFGSILVFHDLTRLRQLENTRQEFVANVSHE
ncbi:MAG TPA: PAS domain-containing protein, partial [Verrucomicrobiae bacterium]|nr:PAS domain-containing protein [Verrucomicrobiae bacterium]